MGRYWVNEVSTTTVLHYTYLLEGRASFDNVAGDGVGAHVDADGVPEGELDQGEGEEEDEEAKAWEEDVQSPGGGQVPQVAERADAQHGHAHGHLFNSISGVPWRHLGTVSPPPFDGVVRSSG